MPQHTADNLTKSEPGIGTNLHELSSDSTSCDSNLKSNSAVYDSETDIELVDDSDSEVEDGEDDSFFDQVEERILNPRNYLCALEIMEAEVAFNSTLRYWHPTWNNLQTSVEGCNPLRCGTVSSDKLCGSSSPCLPMHLSNNYHFEDARTLLEYRNVIARVLANANTMQDARYSTGVFSLLVLDPNRDSVVHLKTFTHTDIVLLFEAFDRACEIAASFDNANSQIMADIESSISSLTIECQKLLDRLCLSLRKPDETHSSILWKSAVQVIDLALVSYAGAHLEAFDKKYLDQEWQTFIIPPPHI